MRKTVNVAKTGLAGLLVWGSLALAAPLYGQQPAAPTYPHGLTPKEGDYVIRDSLLCGES